MGIITLYIFPLTVRKFQKWMQTFLNKGKIHEIHTEQRIELHGFNNLTKSLSFNMYDICYTRTREEREAYLEYIDEQYNADRLTKILKHVSDIIGAHVLNIASRTMYPQGASVTMLVSEGPVVKLQQNPSRNHLGRSRNRW